MKQRLIIWCLVLVVPASLLANRFIVNTGPGPEDLPGFSLGGLQWVAVEFDVTTSATITRVDGWMIVSREGFLDLSLYRDGGEVPGELLFRSTGFVNSGNAEWRGLSSLNWTVTPGTYSIGFERREGGMSGALPFPGKRPLWNGAVVDLESDLTYIEADRSVPPSATPSAADAVRRPEPRSHRRCGLQRTHVPGGIESSSSLARLHGPFPLREEIEHLESMRTRRGFAKTGEREHLVHAERW
jgi:hypothetical protein